MIEELALSALIILLFINLPCSVVTSREYISYYISEIFFLNIALKKEIRRFLIKLFSIVVGLITSGSGEG